MLQLPEQTRQNTITLLVKAIHPSATCEFVNKTLNELQQLKPVEKPKKKGQ